MQLQFPDLHSRMPVKRVMI